MRGPFLWYICVNGILCILYNYMFNVHWIYGLFERYDVDIVLAPRFLELSPNPIHITTKRHSAGPLRVSCCTKSANTSLGLWKNIGTQATWVTLIRTHTISSWVYTVNRTCIFALSYNQTIPSNIAKQKQQTCINTTGKHRAGQSGV